MFKNKIRLPFYLRQPQFPTESNIFRKADGSTKTLSMVVRKTFQGVTDWMNQYMHEKLVVALSHDDVTIEGEALASGVSRDGDYEIEWVDFIDYQKGRGQFQIQVTPFDVTNNNCMTCEEASQLSLVDDDLGAVNEGDELTASVLDNDTICCYPITLEVSSINTDYVDTAVVVGNDIVITLKTPVVSVNDVTLLTYRVTCPSGGYDEADVTADITGTEEGCSPPSDLVYSHVDDSEISTLSDVISYTGSGADSYDWILYECDAPGTPIDSGNETGESIVFIPALTPGQCYIISIRGVCGDAFSEYVNLEFTVDSPAELCGRFLVTGNNGTGSIVPIFFTFMNCLGDLQPGMVVNLSSKTDCFMVDSFNNPIYFAAAIPGTVSYSYQEPC